MTIERPRCPYCDNDSILVTGKQVYPHRKDLWGKKFYVCHPCDARVGCHGTSEKPLGRLANAELRAAKSKAHRFFDPLWREHKRFKNRGAAYAWLAKKMNLPMSQCHIGMFNVEQCREVVNWCKRLLGDYC